MLDLNFYKDKTILVTGHTGFKGTWLCKILINAGAKVVGYALEAPTNPSLFKLSNIEKDMISIIGDIRDYEHLKSVFDKYQPELVIHLAAQPIVRDSYKDPRYTYDTNVMGTVNILECVRLTESVKSFLNVTTDKVYLNDDIPNHPFKEDEPLDGYDPYSNSKSCSELVTHSYKKSFFTDGRCAISTARAGNVIGGGDFANDRIIPDCIRAINGRKTMLIRNPYSTRPYQHVLEPLYVYLEIIEKQYQNRMFEGFYNVGPDIEDCVKTGELVELFAKKWGDDFQYKIEKNIGPHEAAFLMLNTEKLKNMFDWKPRWHIDECVERIVKWTKSYFANENNVAIEMDKEIDDFIGGYYDN